MVHFARGIIALAILFLVGPAVADDWVAVKLRGTVSQFVDQQWQPLKRGDVVPDARFIRTALNGVVQFSRGGETIDLQPNTQIQIFDRHGAKPFTTVNQSFGTVAIEANVENVQHFSVQTPFLAAVVKGTKFVVTSGRTASRVKVNRGHVLVEDNHDQSHVTLSVGQSASVDTTRAAGNIVVSGTGQLPVVLNQNEVPVADSDTQGADHEGDASSKNGKSKKNGGDDGDGPGNGQVGGNGNNASSEGSGKGSSGSGNGNGGGNNGNGNGSGGGNGNGDGNSGNGGGNGNNGNGNGNGHGHGHDGGDD